jgi:hypothetical protein
MEKRDLSEWRRARDFVPLWMEFCEIDRRYSQLINRDRSGADRERERETPTTKPCTMMTSVV